MKGHGIASSAELAALTKILDDYCQQTGIAGSHPEREHLARRLMALFSDGIEKPDDIKMALDLYLEGYHAADRAA